MTAEEIMKHKSALSAKVMSLSVSTLMLNMRYMSKAMGRLPQRQYQGTYSCDGRSVSYDPSHLLARYKQSEKLPVHDLLHMLLHCVFRHWHFGGQMDRLRWDAACDIAVEAVFGFAVAFAVELVLALTDLDSTFAVFDSAVRFSVMMSFPILRFRMLAFVALSIEAPLSRRALYDLLIDLSSIASILKQMQPKLR